MTETAGVAAAVAWAHVHECVEGSPEWEVAMEAWHVAYSAWRVCVGPAYRYGR